MKLKQNIAFTGLLLKLCVFEMCHTIFGNAVLVNIDMDLEYFTLNI